MNTGYTYIVLLNWNGWRDTIACMESLCALEHPRTRIVVCDNDSSDDSLANIQAWCRAELAAQLPENARLRATMRTHTHTYRQPPCFMEFLVFPFHLR